MTNYYTLNMRFVLVCITLVLLGSFKNGMSQTPVGSLVTITSSVPQNLTVCGQAKTFTINIKNPTPFLLQNPVLTVIMPVGMNYQAGSLTGATLQAVNGSTLTFSIADLIAHPAAGSNVLLTFVAFADCDIIPFLFAGNVSNNYVKIDYTKNGTAYYDDNTSVDYIVKQPNVSIINITNQAYSGSVGDVFVRCITIINGGLGELSELKLEDVHGSGISVTSTDKGTRITNGLTETITFSGADFSTIGNGNNLFETGETITVCETIHVVNCVDAQSDYKAYWGCNSKQCQFSTQSGNVVFPGQIPHLVFSPNQGNVYKPMNSCIGPGNPMTQELKIFNDGTGDALNTSLLIYSYPAYQNSYIDMSSVSIQNGVSGATTTISNPTVTTGSSTTCKPAGQPTDFKFIIPVIHPGDTLYLKFNTYTCCNPNSGCNGAGTLQMNGLRYQGSYKNLCNTNYTIGDDWIEVYSYIGAGLANNIIPNNMSNGDSENFNFTFTSYDFFYPKGPGHNWKIKFTLPPCMVLSGALNVINSAGTLTWTPNTVTTVGNVVTATFNGMPPFSLVYADLNIELAVDCSGGCTGGSGSLGVEMSYEPDTGCGCEVSFSCINSPPVLISCPNGGPCPEGMVFNKFKFRRSNYGKPDNEAGGGDGIADAVGSLNFSKIRTDRAMFKDTITALFNGTVKTSATFPNWQYCYASSTITNANNLKYIGAKLRIYRASALIATCNAFTPTVTPIGTTTNYIYDLSTPSLGACLPVGFVYQNNDSVIFEPQYSVVVNIGGVAALNCDVTNEYYMSPVATPTNSADKYQCNEQIGSCSLIGYYFTMAYAQNIYAKSCDISSLVQTYYLSVGPCCNNYHGGNIFPFEYRYWAHLENMEVVLPPNYEFMSATIWDYRTSGTGGYGQSTTTITPLSVATNTLLFNTEPLYAGYGGIFPLSDDGFAGTLEVKVRPTCSTRQDVWDTIKYTATFAPIDSLKGAGSYTTAVTGSDDYIIYDGPEIQMQASLLSVNVPNDTTGWTISLTNNSAADAHNVWISAPTISGVSILKLYDLDNSTLISPINGIYQLGLLNSVSVRNFLLVADFTSCQPDSIVVYSGWNCAGYPSSLASYPCTPEKITLKETPLLPNLVTSAQGPTTDIALCDTADYIVTIRNVQLGSAYNISLFATLPTGVSIVPGTSMLSYPTVNSFTLISNPTLVSGTLWKWDISALNSQLSIGGIKGILDSLFGKITLKFKVIASCGYTSGSAINFSTKAFAACGLPTGDEVSLSSNLSIAGANAPYLTQVKLKSNFITPCSSSNVMRVAIINKGPLAFQTTDSITVSLPPGVTYVAGSFSGVHNGPSSTIPQQTSFNGEALLLWPLTSGVAVGDSVVFNFNYQGNPSILNCTTSEFKAKTIVKQNLACLTGSNCDISVITGDTNLIIFTYKPYLSFTGGTVSAVPYQTSGETITVGFDIFNAGEKIQVGTPTIISYYYDTDGNGIFSPSDFYITRDTITASIDSNNVYNYGTSITSPAGKACNLLAVLDTAINYCSCTTTQLILHPRLINAGNDIALCSGLTGTIGLSPTAGYTYSWSPNTGISNVLTANPTVTLTNGTTATQTHSYILTTNRISCTTKDTVVVTIYPLPIVTANTQTICIGQQTATLNASGALNYTWSPTSTLSNANGNVVSATPTITTTYTLIGSDVNGCLNTTTSKVKVNPLPIITANSPTICVGQQTATLSANGGTVYIWNPSASLSSATGSVVTGTPATTTNYTITSTDINGCVNTTTTNIYVNTLPIISPTTSAICTGQTTTLTVSGASSYTWSPATDLSSATGSFVTGTPTITTNFTVTGIDQNGCINDGFITSTVHDLPVPSFTPANNCLNTGITFNNTSTMFPPDNIAKHIWKFDNNSSKATDTLYTNASPIGVTYNLNGIHTITLTAVSNHSCFAQATNTVMVYAQPVANFSTTSVCSSSVTNFTDLSTSVDGVLNSWDWDFTSDNVVDASVQYTTTIYPASGDYTASLIVSSVYGCKDTIAKKVIVWGEAIPNFSANPVCLGTITSFTNTTDTTTNLNVGGAPSYTWTLGNGANTTQQVNPSHSYTTSTNVNSSWNVTLQTKTINGCIASTTLPVHAYALPTANFTSDSVCLNEASHVFDASNGNGNPLYSYTWDFSGVGSPTTSLIPSDSYTFSNMGIHIVNYTVTSMPVNGLTCSNNTFKVVWVNPLPSPNFVTNNSCINEQPINFNASTSSIAYGSNTNYTWDFGDLNVGNGSITTHSYSTSGIYSVSLTVFSDKNCSAIISKDVEVYPKPVVAIPNFSACYNTITTFSATNLDNTIPITNWRWDLNNFIPSIEKTGAIVNYAFTATGSHTIHLLTETQYGCKDTIEKIIYIDYVPIPEFTSPNPAGCPTHCVTFTDLTLPITGPGVNANWQWDFGDGTSVNATTGASQEHCYTNTDSTLSLHYNVRLIVTTDKGCRDSIVKPSYVTVYPTPHAEYIVTPTQINISMPLAEFTNHSSGFVSWSWDFGDGTTKDVTHLNPSHLYQDATARTYTSNLIVMNQYGCTDTALVLLEIDPEFTFYIPNTFTPANYDGINDVFSGKGIGIVKYEMWIFDRWGEQIYYTDDIIRGWDGTVQGKGDEKKQDVYTWKVKLVDVFDRKHSYIGHVTLLR